jgi:hypothetical protein
MLVHEAIGLFPRQEIWSSGKYSNPLPSSLTLVASFSWGNREQDQDFLRSYREIVPLNEQTK